jgi:tripartite-type tricarboxylate transporter receptor subunit TctC
LLALQNAIEEHRHETSPPQTSASGSERLMLSAVSRISLALDYPTRPVKFILTLGPGSGADIGARLFADRLARRWGQPVVVENRPGGDGIVAISAFVGAHDDHELLFSPTSSFTAHPFLQDHLPYRPDDLVPITRISNTIITISVPSSLNVNSLDQLIALARAQPGKLNWAGVTGALDFIFAGWLKREGIEIAKIAYKIPSMPPMTSPRDACKSTSRRSRLCARSFNRAKSSFFA